MVNYMLDPTGPHRSPSQGVDAAGLEATAESSGASTPIPGEVSSVQAAGENRNAVTMKL